MTQGKLSTTKSISSCSNKSSPCAKGSPREARQFFNDIDVHTNRLLHSYRSHVFTTDIDYKVIWDAYLDHLPSKISAEYSC